MIKMGVVLSGSCPKDIYCSFSDRSQQDLSDLDGSLSFLFCFCLKPCNTQNINEDARFPGIHAQMTASLGMVASQVLVLNAPF